MLKPICWSSPSSNGVVRPVRAGNDFDQANGEAQHNDVPVPFPVVSLKTFMNFFRHISERPEIGPRPGDMACWQAHEYLIWRQSSQSRRDALTLNQSHGEFQRCTWCTKEI